MSAIERARGIRKAVSIDEVGAIYYWGDVPSVAVGALVCRRCDKEQEN